MNFDKHFIQQKTCPITVTSLFASRETEINTSAKFRRQTRCIMGSVDVETLYITMLKSLESMNTLFDIAFNATQLNLYINTEKLLRTFRHLNMYKPLSTSLSVSCFSLVVCTRD